MMNGLARLFLSAVLALLVACGGDDGGAVFDSEPIPENSTQVSASMVSLGTTQNTVSSDNSDSATITATAFDENNAVMKDVQLFFSATSGQLSNSSGATDESGTFTLDFSSGTSSAENTTATVTATTSNGATASIPVQIVGSTVAVSLSSSSLVSGDPSNDTAIVTVSAKNSGGVGVYDAAVTLSTSDAGVATLGDTTGTTDASGEFTTTLTGIASGTATLTVSSLGDTKTVDFSVSGSGTAFRIASPTDESVTVAINADQPVIVDAPSIESVTFVTSHGGWFECGGTPTCPIPVGADSATATLTAATSGTATVQAFNSADVSQSDSLTVTVVNDTVDNSSTVSLQAEETTVPISSGSALYSTTITAKVRDGSNQPISGAAVIFTLSNTTGGGEYLQPTVAISDEYGNATTTFTSGTNSSTPSVQVIGHLYDSSYVEVDTGTVDIFINQIAGSVVISPGTKILANDENTAYIQPMAVLVADVNGSAVAGQNVNLRVWPKKFQTGYWTADPCAPIVTGTFDNEDTDRDLVKDAGEDIVLDEVLLTADLNGDGDQADVYDDQILTPGGSAGGSVPYSVTTDSNGVANFELTYLKNSAIWIVDEITATTQVDGTETTGKLTMVLPYMEGEQCNLPSSPFNPS